MKRTALFACGCALLLAGLADPAPAAQRTFVASHGLDTNPCTLASPCRGFAAAVAVTDAGGEVIVLDSAGYGPVTIAKSVSIVAPPGVYAGITAASGTAVIIDPGAGGKVALRGLSINAVAASGISIISGDEVRIQDCDISHSPDSGISISGGASIHIAGCRLQSNSSGITVVNGAPEVFVGDTLVSDSSALGIGHQAGSLTLDRVRSENNLVGLRVEPRPATTARAVVRDSRFSGNSLGGVEVIAAVSGQVALVSIERSSLERNQDGVLASGADGEVSVALWKAVVSENSRFGVAANSPVTRLSASRIRVTRNGTGISQGDSATVVSYGNNVVGENGTNTIGTITPALLQ